jgi:hypothetical protein
MILILRMHEFVLVNFLPMASCKGYILANTATLSCIIKYGIML